MTFDSLLTDQTIQFLIEAEPWTVYRTLTDLLGKPQDDQDVIRSRQAVVNDPFTKKLIKNLTPWFPESITRHNHPEIPPHRLKLLAELGVRAEDSAISTVISDIESHLDQNMYATRQTLPEKSIKPPSKHADEWHSLPCDSPEIASALWHIGHESDTLRKVTDEIAARWLSDEHWFYHFFFVEDQFKTHDAACPMAGLMALDLFSRTGHASNEPLIDKCFAPLAYHKNLGKSLYYFGRSKKFWTFKFPFVWYNALYLADVLTRFPQLHNTPVVNELIDWVLAGKTNDGTWKATSVFKPFKDMDFGRKKTPSAWITYLCLRILKQRFGKT